MTADGNFNLPTGICGAWAYMHTYWRFLNTTPGHYLDPYATTLIFWIVPLGLCSEISGTTFTITISWHIYKWSLKQYYSPMSTLSHASHHIATDLISSHLVFQLSQTQTMSGCSLISAQKVQYWGWSPEGDLTLPSGSPRTNYSMLMSS